MTAHAGLGRFPGVALHTVTRPPTCLGTSSTGGVPVYSREVPKKSFADGLSEHEAEQQPHQGGLIDGRDQPRRDDAGMVQALEHD